MLPFDEHCCSVPGQYGALDVVFINPRGTRSSSLFCKIIMDNVAHLDSHVYEAGLTTAIPMQDQGAVAAVPASRSLVCL